MNMIVEYHFFHCHWLNAFAAEANVFGRKLGMHEFKAFGIDDKPSSIMRGQ